MRALSGHISIWDVFCYCVNNTNFHSSPFYIVLVLCFFLKMCFVAFHSGPSCPPPPGTLPVAMNPAMTLPLLPPVGFDPRQCRPGGPPMGHPMNNPPPFFTRPPPVGVRFNPIIFARELALCATLRHLSLHLEHAVSSFPLLFTLLSHFSLFSFSFFPFIFFYLFSLSLPSFHFLFPLSTVSSLFPPFAKIRTK